jgi:sulfur carrier protein
MTAPDSPRGQGGSVGSDVADVSVVSAERGPTEIGVVINGVPTRLPTGTVLGTVVGRVTTTRAGVAAALNDAVVPRTAWDTHVLDEGDRVEILTAVQGG